LFSGADLEAFTREAAVQALQDGLGSDWAQVARGNAKTGEDVDTTPRTDIQDESLNSSSAQTALVRRCHFLKVCWH